MNLLITIAAIVLALVVGGLSKLLEQKIDDNIELRKKNKELRKQILEKKWGKSE